MLNNICETHKNRKIKYLCVSQKCGGPVRSCILCIKSSHSKCMATSILTINCRTNYNLSQFPDLEFCKQLSEIFETQFAKKAIDIFRESTKTALEKSLENQKEEEAIKITPENELKYILKNKENFDIQKNLQTQKIDIKRNQVSAEKFNECKNDFESQISRPLKCLLQGLNEISLYGYTSFEIEDFNVHPSLELTKTETGNMKLRVVSNNNEYYLCVLNKPVKKNLSVEVNITVLNKSDRYVEMGFMKKSQFEEISTYLIGFNLFAETSFNGYGKKGFEGTLLTTSMSSELGLNEGDVLGWDCVKQNGETEVKLNGKILLSAVIKDMEEEDYYFYIALYFLDQEVEVKFHNK